jgi:hypothetical protein
MQLMMDALIAHFKEQQELHHNNTSFTESIITAWHAFDKYYNLIDQTGAYTAAILLHPSYRKSYLQTAWHRDWVSPGIERARTIWQQYKDFEDYTTNTEDTAQMTQYERYCLKIQQQQQRSLLKAIATNLNGLLTHLRLRSIHLRLKGGYSDSKGRRIYGYLRWQ